jgi:hypothetical protein
MRYWVRSVLGAGLFLACVVVFNLKLVEDGDRRPAPRRIDLRAVHLGRHLHHPR